jgi:hypothetical protein
VLRHLPSVLGAAGYDPARPATAWSIASWLRTEDPEFNDLTPLEMVRAGHLDPVLAAARNLADAFGVRDRPDPA